MKTVKKTKFKTTYKIVKPVVRNTKTVEYPNNFESNGKILETKITLENDINNGFSKHFVFDGIRLEYRDLQIKSPLIAEVSTNFPYLKMQFSINGSCSYTTSNLNIDVQRGHHQLFFIPEVKNTLVTFEKKAKLFVLN